MDALSGARVHDIVDLAEAPAKEAVVMASRSLG
jgi:hypothetical protein